MQPMTAKELAEKYADRASRRIVASLHRLMSAQRRVVHLSLPALPKGPLLLSREGQDASASVTVEAGGGRLQIYSWQSEGGPIATSVDCHTPDTVDAAALAIAIDAESTRLDRVANEADAHVRAGEIAVGVIRQAILDSAAVGDIPAQD